MPKAIAFIPAKQRIERHKVDYLRAISDVMDNPWQSEDGRDLAPIQQELNKKCAELSQLPYWTFTNCCTDSLQIAVQTFTKPGDLVLVPAYGWRGFANAVAYMNREVEFLDVDMTGNLDVEKAIKRVKLTPKPAAIFMVHNFGAIANVKELCDVCREIGIKTVEDAAPSFIIDEQSMVSYMPGSASDMVCYSFDFTKNPGTLGSGGGIATRFADVHSAVYEIQAHETNKQKEVVRIGTKSYLDNTSCAVLLKEIQIYEQNHYRERRRQIAIWLENNLSYKSIPGENYIWERYSMFVPYNEVGIVLERLQAIRILARTMFKQPLHTYPFFDKQQDLPVVMEFTNNLIHLPCHHYLSEDDLFKIKEAIG